jgi:hypothetical protein
MDNEASTTVRAGASGERSFTDLEWASRPSSNQLNPSVDWH